MPVDTAWFITKRDTHAVRANAGRHQFRQRQPYAYAGPIAKNAMKTNSVMATIHPLWVLGTGLINALSIRSCAWETHRDC